MDPTESSKQPVGAEQVERTHPSQAQSSHDEPQQESEVAALAASHTSSSRLLSPRKTQPQDYRSLSGLPTKSVAEPQERAPKSSKSAGSRQKSKGAAQVSSDGTDAYEQNRLANIKANEEIFRSLRFDVSVSRDV